MPQEHRSVVNEEDFDDPNFLRRDNQRTKDITMSPYDHEKMFDALKLTESTSHGKDESPLGRPSDSPLEHKYYIPTPFQSRDADVDAVPSRQTSTIRDEGLAAYHDALADAANKAAADGRFSRQTSTATSSSQYSERSRHAPLSVVTDGAAVTRQTSHPRHQVGGSRGHDTYSGFDFGFEDPRMQATKSTSPPPSVTFPTSAFSPVAEGIYDDDYDSDDAIISEANADALASDDEGFYGQEFGFYARSRSGSEEGEAVNGGFFGAPGIDMIERKWSVREPNLTPITERSEFSTRSSFIGSSFSPIGPQMTHNPAFAGQLARMSPMALAQMHEEDISLETFMKMRTHAFGGSDSQGNASTPRSGSMSSLSSHSVAHGHSSSGSQLGPFGGPRVGGTAMVFQYSNDSNRSSAHGSHSRNHSRSHSASIQGSQSLPGSGDVSAYRTASPVLESPYEPREAMSNSPSGTSLTGPDLDTTPRKATMDGGSPLYVQTPPTVQKSSLMSRPGRRHSRNLSGGADSVTYKKEQDEAGNERWILERRRTSEAGVWEVVGREVVEGGCI